MYLRLQKDAGEHHIAEISDSAFGSHYSEPPLSNIWLIHEIVGLSCAQFRIDNPEPELILIDETTDSYKWKHTDLKYYKLNTKKRHAQRYDLIMGTVINRYAETPNNLTEEVL